MIYLGNIWVIPATFVIAFLLVILPLPEWAGPMRPEWVGMVAIYWCLAVPRVFGVGTAWIIGLILDVAHGSLLGQHALGLSIIAYIATRLHQQIRPVPTRTAGGSRHYIVACEANRCAVDLRHHRSIAG